MQEAESWRAMEGKLGKEVWENHDEHWKVIESIDGRTIGVHKPQEIF